MSDVTFNRVEKILNDMDSIWGKLGDATLDVPLNNEKELSLLLSGYDTKKYTIIRSGIDDDNYVLVFGRIQNA